MIIQNYFVFGKTLAGPLKTEVQISCLDTGLKTLTRLADEEHCDSKPSLPAEREGVKMSRW